MYSLRGLWLFYTTRCMDLIWKNKVVIVLTSRGWVVSGSPHWWHASIYHRLYCTGSQLTVTAIHQGVVFVQQAHPTAIRAGPSLPPSANFPLFFLLLDSGTAALDSRAEPSEMAVPGSRQKMAQRLPQECSNFSWRLFRDDWTEKGHKDAGLYPMTRRVVQGRQYWHGGLRGEALWLVAAPGITRHVFAEESWSAFRPLGPMVASPLRGCTFLPFGLCRPHSDTDCSQCPVERM